MMSTPSASGVQQEEELLCRVGERDDFARSFQAKDLRKPGTFGDVTSMFDRKSLYNYHEHPLGISSTTQNFTKISQYIHPEFS